MRHYGVDGNIPDELEAWTGEPLVRVAHSEGRSIRIERDGMGHLVEIPEDRPAEGFRAMTFRERSMPVPDLAPKDEAAMLSVSDRRELILSEIEQVGSATNRELMERLGWSLGAIYEATRFLHATGCLERKRCRTTKGQPPWRFRATGRPIREEPAKPNELVRRRYRRDPLELFRLQARVTVSEAADALGCFRKRARIHLERLFAEGLVARIDDIKPITFVSLIVQRLASSPQGKAPGRNRALTEPSRSHLGFGRGVSRCGR